MSPNGNKFVFIVFFLFFFYVHRNTKNTKSTSFQEHCVLENMFGFYFFFSHKHGEYKKHSFSKNIKIVLSVFFKIETKLALTFCDLFLLNSTNISKGQFGSAS